MGFFQKLGNNMRRAMSRFMTGRYGNDKLNMAILTVSAVLCLLCLFLPVGGARSWMMLVCYGLLILSIYRMLSRKTYKRYRENRKFLQSIARIRDREHRYYDCPRCHQQVRVPRGKGKISISCPKCKEHFIKKT